MKTVINTKTEQNIEKKEARHSAPYKRIEEYYYKLKNSEKNETAVQKYYISNIKHILVSAAAVIISAAVLSLIAINSFNLISVHFTAALAAAAAYGITALSAAAVISFASFIKY